MFVWEAGAKCLVLWFATLVLVGFILTAPAGGPIETIVLVPRLVSPWPSFCELLLTPSADMKDGRGSEDGNERRPVWRRVSVRERERDLRFAAMNRGMDDWFVRLSTDSDDECIS